MRKRIIIFLVVVLAFFLYLRLTYPGMYSPLLGKVLWCDTEKSCKHEEGHVADATCADFPWQYWKWCSTDPRFRELVNEVASLDVEESTVVKTIRDFPSSKYHELYAEIYSWIPEDITVIGFLEATLEYYK